MSEAIKPAVEQPAKDASEQGTRNDVVRFDPAATFKREAQFSRAAINKADRTCELSFSSELPVRRMGYVEILSHDPEFCDLSRLNNSHPLLLNHDPEDQIGVIEKAWIGEDRKGRAIVRFSKSEDGEEIWNDVVDGIRRLVSVGYRIIKEVICKSENGVDACTFAWQPYEISIVSVPADATVGVGRSQTISESQQPKKEKTKVSAEVINEAPKRDFTKEAAEIFAIRDSLGKKQINVRELADKAISEGWSVDNFRKEAFNHIPEAKPVTSSPLAEVKARDWKKYSIARAISMQMPGEKRDGIEAELDQELAIKYGRRAQGLYIPDEALSRSLVAGTATLGGMIVETSVASNEFIEILRNKAQVLNLGARILNLQNPVTIPRQNGAGTVNWVTETTASTLSALNFQNITLTPKGVTAQHQYSKELLMTGNPSVDMLIRDDITQTLALAIDLAALHGTGSAQPTGIAGTTGIGTVTAAANGIALDTLAATCYAAMVSLETAVAASNADAGALAYLVRSPHRGSLKKVSRFASTDTPVFSDGQINGYRAEVSNQIATNLTTGTATTICSAIFFGNWNELLIASFGSTDLVVDPYSAAANSVVKLFAKRWVDIGVRHPASFAVMGGIL